MNPRLFTDLTQLPQLQDYRHCNLLKSRNAIQKVVTTNCVLNIFSAGSILDVEAM
jgi:hypothetical protein